MKSVNARRIVATLVILASMGCAPNNQDGKRDDSNELPDLAKIQGFWRIVKSVHGKERPATYPRAEFVVFDKDRMHLRDSDTWPFTLDPDKNPRRMVASLHGGKARWIGIYKLDGNELTLYFFDDKSEDAPKEFSDKAPNRAAWRFELVRDSNHKSDPETLKASAKGSHIMEAKVRSWKNLRRLALGLQAYHDQYRRLPSSTHQFFGRKSLFSWRVAILPFVGEEALFGQFNFDEPWDALHNMKVAEKMPSCYQSEVDPSKAGGLTRYQVFTNRDHMLFGSSGRRMPESCTDGAANTLVIVESSQAVPWTKPVDIPFDPKKDEVPKLGGVFEDGFFAARCDTGVVFIRRDIDPVTLRALITPWGGEKIDHSKLE